MNQLEGFARAGGGAGPTMSLPSVATAALLAGFTPRDSPRTNHDRGRHGYAFRFCFCIVVTC